MGDQGILVMVF